jgi:hypothetical protein
MPGTDVYVDGMLGWLYRRLKEENKVALTFCGENKTEDQFISFFDRLKTMQILCEIGPPEKPGDPGSKSDLQPVGFSWVDAPVGVDGQRSAQPGEAFFHNASKRSSARDLARLALAYTMNDLKIDVYHGIQLASNVAARNFALKVGFKEVAIVPRRLYHEGKLQDARVMMLEASEFLPPFWEWIDEEHRKMDEQKPVESEPAIV